MYSGLGSTNKTIKGIAKCLRYQTALHTIQFNFGGYIGYEGYIQHKFSSDGVILAALK